jgi:hypothetical protein
MSNQIKSLNLNHTAPLKNQTNFHQEIKALLQNAKNKIYTNINSTMTQTYWLIGQKIVEVEQALESRAKYGKALNILEFVGLANKNEFKKILDTDSEI